MKKILGVFVGCLFILQAKGAVTVSLEKAKQLYNDHCFVCHYAGGASSPKTGEPNAWNPRIKQGKELLLKHTWEGLNFMPAKGLCNTCSRQELDAVIDYMLSQCPACDKLPAKSKNKQ